MSNTLNVVDLNDLPIFGRTATRITFGAPTVVYGQSATAQYVVEDSSGVITAGSVTTTPEQYADWGTDDSYIIQCFLTNLGLS